MTDQEAMEILKKPCLCDYDLSKTIFDCDIEQCDKRDAVLQAIKALEEVQTYRAIGTPKECRASMEKQKPHKWERGIENDVRCPFCGAMTTKTYEHRYCSSCGHRLE